MRVVLNVVALSMLKLLKLFKWTTLSALSASLREGYSTRFQSRMIQFESKLNRLLWAIFRWDSASTSNRHEQ